MPSANLGSLRGRCQRAGEAIQQDCVRARMEHELLRGDLALARAQGQLLEQLVSRQLASKTGHGCGQLTERVCVQGRQDAQLENGKGISVNFCSEGEEHIQAMPIRGGVKK